MSVFRSPKSAKVVAAALGMAAALATTVACGSSGSSTSEDGLTIIRIGVAAPTAEQSLAAVAQELGFFKKHGIDAKVELIPGGPQITAGLVGNSLDFGVYSAPGPEVAIVQGAKLKYVGEWTHRSNLGLVAAPGIDSVKDLEGKTVAVSSPGTTTAIYTDMMLREAGLDPEKSVVRRNVGGQGAALSAFASGQVKAAIFGAPVTYAALAQVKGSKVLIDYNQHDFAWPYAGIVATEAYTEKNAKTITNVVAALKEAAAAYQDPAQADKIKAIISKFTQTADRDAVNRSFEVASKAIDPTLLPLAADHENVLEQLAVTEPAAKKFTASDMFDTSFAENPK